MTQPAASGGRPVSRRRFLGGLAATAAAGHWGGFSALAREAACRHLAGRRIRWIVPYAVGGGYDLEARLLQPFLEEALDTQIAVENLTGAGGVVGLRTLARAKKDGLTLGMCNGSGLLVAALSGTAGTPHPLHDLTILGRTGRNHGILVTGTSSPFKTVDDLVRPSSRRPLLVAASLGSNSFLLSVVLSDLLHVTMRPILGYHGSISSALATMRGDVDVTTYSFESLLPQIESGDLRPLLQLGDHPVSTHPSLATVPVLGGPDGWAVRRARASGRSAEAAEDDAAALAALLAAGRLITAPSGLDVEVVGCLDRAIGDTLSDPRFTTAMTRARRPLDTATREGARRDFVTASRHSARFMPLIREALRALGI